VNFLLSVFLALNCISIHSKIVSQNFVDSIKKNLPDTLSDSAIVPIVVKKLIDYLEGVGVIDPQIEVWREEKCISFFVKNEKVKPISRVYFDLKGERKSFSYLNTFLKNGFFLREHFSRTTKFFDRLEIFEVRNYYFLRSDGEYSLILGISNSSPPPLLVGGMENGRVWFRSTIGYSNLYYFPFRFVVDFSVFGSDIQSLRGKAVFPVDITHSLFLSTEIWSEAFSLKYGLAFGKIIDVGRAQFFIRAGQRGKVNYGVSTSAEFSEFDMVLRVEKASYLKHLIFVEYETKRSVGPGLVFLKTNLEGNYPIEGGGSLLSNGVPYFKVFLKINNLSVYKTFFAVNYYGINFRLPTKSGVLHLGLSYPSSGKSFRDLEFNFGLSKKSILFDYLSTFY
jgi:hypothetical protein